MPICFAPCGTATNEKSPLGNRVIEAGWLVLAAGLPVCFAPWGRNPFELPKALLLWVAVAVMGVARYMIHDAGCKTHARSGIMRPVPCILYPFLVLVLAGVLLLTTLLSTNSLLSAQGSYDRMQGAITVLCYLALFLLVADRLREPAQARRLLAAIAWGSAPVVAYGLLQAMGLDPLDWRTEGSPVISTLGRSNFLGAYLVLVLPLTTASAWLARDRTQRVAYVVLIGAQLACLLMTGARAAWLGALAAGGVLILAAAWHRGHRRLAVVGGGVDLVGLGLGLVVLALFPELEGSLGARTAIWRATWPLVAARPLLGYGPETFAQVFTGVFPPELVYLQGRGVLVDRAHNLVLDTLASTGVLGLLAYAALVGTALAAGLRAFVQARDRSVRVVLAAGLAAVVGHLVETQLSFSVTTTATLFWLTLGMLVAPWSSPSFIGSREKSRKRWHKLLFVLPLVAIPIALTFLAADAVAGDANHTRTLADLEHSIAAARQSTVLWPTQPAYRTHLSWLHLQRARRSSNPLPDFQAAEAALNAARRLTPGDYQIWAGYGELYAEWGRAGDPTRFAQAEEAYRQASALFPGSAMLHTGWGLCYVVQGRPAEAEAQFHQAITLDNTDAWAYRYLGDLLLARGDAAGAERAYRDALRWEPDMAEAYRGLGHVYRRRGQFQTALSFYQRALDRAPGDPNVYLDVARCQWDLDRRELACQTVARGLLLAPEHQGLLVLRAECAR